jgi:hypothetical protein
LTRRFVTAHSACHPERIEGLLSHWAFLGVLCVSAVKSF